MCFSLPYPQASTFGMLARIARPKSPGITTLRHSMA